MYCQKCGAELDFVEKGGCGGRGDIYRCPNPKCKALFRQISGGILPTEGGETLKRIPGDYFPEEMGE